MDNRDTLSPPTMLIERRFRLYITDLVFGLLVATVPACAGLTPEQQAAIAKVQLITTEPALNCQNLGSVSGSRDSIGRGGIRAKAVILGGNTVFIDVHGATTAFYCPGEAPPRALIPSKM